MEQQLEEIKKAAAAEKSEKRNSNGNGDAGGADGSGNQGRGIGQGEGSDKKDEEAAAGADGAAGAVVAVKSEKLLVDEEPKEASGNEKADEEASGNKSGNDEAKADEEASGNNAAQRPSPVWTNRQIDAENRRLWKYRYSKQSKADYEMWIRQEKSSILSAISSALQTMQDSFRKYLFFKEALKVAEDPEDCGKFSPLGNTCFLRKL